MRITVCELPDDPTAFVPAWDALISHVRSEASELLLLPETPFYPWFADSQHFDPVVWQKAVAAHDEWELRLHEATPALVAGARPMDFGGERYNEAFLWDHEYGSRPMHSKTLLAGETGVWEPAWYNRAAPEFTPVQVGQANAGFLIGAELWMMNQVQAYGLEDVHLLLAPRSTGAAATQTWLAAARVAAVLAGAYVLSSNRVSVDGFGGQGWIIDPNGDVLGYTDEQHPCVTVDVDLAAAGRVEDRYFPRYARARPEHLDQVRPRPSKWASLQRWRRQGSTV